MIITVRIFLLFQRAHLHFVGRICSPLAPFHQESWLSTKGNTSKHLLKSIKIPTILKELEQTDRNFLPVISRARQRAVSSWLQGSAGGQSVHGSRHVPPAARAEALLWAAPAASAAGRRCSSSWAQTWICGICPLRPGCFHRRGCVAALPLKGVRLLPADGTSTTNFPTILLVVRGSQENPLPRVTKFCRQWIIGWALSLQLSRRLSS